MSIIHLVAAVLIAGGPGKPPIAVMTLEGQGLSAEQISTLSEALTTELSSLDRYQVISTRDVLAMLENETNKQQLGCDDTSCFAELGGALGADFLLVPQVGRLDDSYVLNLKLIDVRQSQTLRRVSEHITGDLDDVLEAIRFSVRAITDPSAGQGIVRGRPLISPAPVVLGSASVVALCTGAFFGLRAKSSYAHATDPSYAGGQREVSRGENAQTIANVAFIGSAASALAAAILYLWWDTDVLTSSAPAAALGPAVEGQGLSLTVRY